MLIPDYYRIEKMEKRENNTLFSISLNPLCKVYDGHFPGEPVSPGVCNIQMIKECVEQVVGTPLLLAGMSKCRLLELMNPVTHAKVELEIELQEQSESGVKVYAVLGMDEQTYIDMKAEFVYSKTDRKE